MHQRQLQTDHFRTKQLADYWSISERTLERWRLIGKGPAFLKIEGCILYRMTDVLEYESRSAGRY